MKTSIIALVVTASLAFAGAASAAVTYNANLAPPGTYYGSGNPEGAWTVNLEDGVEQALRFKLYQDPVLLTPTGNVYQKNDVVKVASLDWSFNPGADGTPISLAGLMSSMTILNVGTGGSFTFDPLAIPDNDTDLGAPGGEQNSWRMSFGFLNGPGGLGYTAGGDLTLKATWTIFGDEFGTMTNTVYLNQGAGNGAVPEPGTWALMIAGFGGVGAMLRRRQRAAFA